MGCDLKPYYEEDGITIYHGDCREILPHLAKVDLVLTDPPYGIGWSRGARGKYRPNDCGNQGIQGDENTSVRDEVLELFGQQTPALVFGSFYASFPQGIKQILVYHKPSYAGLIGAVTPFRRDSEPIFLLGEWPKSVPCSSSVIHAENGLNGSGIYSGHPHTKPISVILQLLLVCSFQCVLDPFMGSGTTLVAARQLGRRAIGIEIEERYCEIAVKRLAQSMLDFGEFPAAVQPIEQSELF